jgi:signal transduction histidine kinase
MQGPVSITLSKARNGRPKLGLRARFVIVITVVLLISCSIAAALLLHNSRKSLTTNLNQSTQAFAALATRPIGDSYAIYQDSGSLRVAVEIEKFTVLNGNVSNVAIIDTSGNLLYALHSKPSITVSSKMAASFSAIDTKNSLGEITQVIQPYLNTDGLHEYNIAYSICIARQADTILIFTILALLITATVTYWLVNKLFLKPIESISNESLLISKGEYSEQIKSHRNDEIGILANSVNQMATNLKNDIFKLEEVDTLKNEFIMITSHNLRTPLTIIEGNMEIIKDSEMPDKLRSMFSAIEDGLKRLKSFSEDILTIASIEAGQTQLSKRSATVKELLQGLNEKYTQAAEQKNINLHWQVEHEDIRLNVSRTHIGSVVRNLLDNAIKFTKINGNVWFSLEVEGSNLKIIVRDDGIGIAANEMTKLFQKFHRGTSTLTYDYEGTGIGLYATKLIVQSYGGKVTASSALGHGSEFTVVIPAALAPET